MHFFAQAGSALLSAVLLGSISTVCATPVATATAPPTIYTPIPYPKLCGPALPAPCQTCSSQIAQAQAPLKASFDPFMKPSVRAGLFIEATRPGMNCYLANGCVVSTRFSCLDGTVFDAPQELVDEYRAKGLPMTSDGTNKDPLHLAPADPKKVVG